MTKAKFPPKPFFLYGVWYASRDEAIKKLNLTGYSELYIHMRRFAKNLPFRERSRVNNATHEKLERFKEIYRKHGIKFKDGK